MTSAGITATPSLRFTAASAAWSRATTVTVAHWLTRAEPEAEASAAAGHHDGLVLEAHLLAPVSRDCLNLGRSGPRKRITVAPLLQSAAVAAPNASAFLRANAGDGFAKGRDFQAWLGLVPRQISTGDRTILGKISKRGNRYLRVLFVQAAWVVLVKVKPTRWKGHGLQSWIEAGLHRNVLAIAVAAFRSSRFINRVRP